MGEGKSWVFGGESVAKAEPGFLNLFWRGERDSTSKNEKGERAASLA
jgi:hypothetical protein